MLTDMENDNTMTQMELPSPCPKAQSDYFGPANFTWLVRGRFGGMPCPGIMRPAEVDLDAVARIGLSVVVTLTEEWQPPVPMMRERGIESLYVPIPDMQPPTLEQAFDTCEAVAKEVAEGKSVVFHCHGGRGRTGTLLAAMLIWYEPDSEAAIKKVKSINPYWIESDSQLEFLEEFAVEHRKRMGRP